MTGTSMAEFLALMPPGVGPGLYGGLLAASFAASLITAAFGIGGGAILLAILAILLPPAALMLASGLLGMLRLCGGGRGKTGTPISRP